MDWEQCFPPPETFSLDLLPSSEYPSLKQSERYVWLIVDPHILSDIYALPVTRAGMVLSQILLPVLFGETTILLLPQLIVL